MNRTARTPVLATVVAGTGLVAIVWGPVTQLWADSPVGRPRGSGVVLSPAREAETPTAGTVARGAPNIPANFDPFGEPGKSPPPNTGINTGTSPTTNPASRPGFFSGIANTFSNSGSVQAAGISNASVRPSAPLPQWGGVTSPVAAPGMPPPQGAALANGPLGYRPGGGVPPGLAAPGTVPGTGSGMVPGTALGVAYPQGYPPPAAGANPTGAAPPAPSKGLFTSLSNWTNDRAKSLRTLMTGQPARPLPEPRVGQVPQPQPNGPSPAVPGQSAPEGLGGQLGQPGQPTQPANINPAAPFRGTTANGAPALAGRPAYRWYGWGSTTPGQNPYAPTGDYPPASAQWYAMSGATPGAFPIPVAHPFRSPPNHEPPRYATTPGRDKPTESAVASQTLVPPPVWETRPPTGPQPIAETPPFTYQPGEMPVNRPEVPSVPPAGSDWRSLTTPLGTPATAAPSPVGPFSKWPGNGDEQNWQPVHYRATSPTPAPSATRKPEANWQPIAPPVPREPDAPGPRVRSQSTDRTSTIADRVQTVVDAAIGASAGAAVTNLEVKRLGPATVIVRFNVTSSQAAQVAAQAIAAMPEFRNDAVTFDAVVPSK